MQCNAMKVQMSAAQLKQSDSHAQQYVSNAIHKPPPLRLLPQFVFADLCMIVQQLHAQCHCYIQILRK